MFGVTGSSYDFGARMYNSRLGRFMSTDPWEDKYAWQTPYAYFKNSPISTIDWKGFGEGDKKGDTFTGDDGKTYTTSSDAAEVVADKPMPAGSGVYRTDVYDKIVAANTNLDNAAGIVEKGFEIAKKGKLKGKAGGIGYITGSIEIGFDIYDYTHGKTDKTGKNGYIDHLNSVQTDHLKTLAKNCNY